MTWLTPTEFEERPVVAVEPVQDDMYQEGVHTLSVGGEFALIDVQCFTFVKSDFLVAARNERNWLIVSISKLLGGSTRPSNFPG